MSTATIRHTATAIRTDERRASLIRRAIRAQAVAARQRTAGQDALAACTEHHARTLVAALRRHVEAVTR